jgi:hypothetical protein
MDKITLAEGATGEELNRIHPAHVRFHDSHEILFGNVSQFLKGELCRADADGQARARMPMKGYRFVD